MKGLKKTALSAARMVWIGDRNNISTSGVQVIEIKLKAVTNDERQFMRIPSYQYILP